MKTEITITKSDTGFADIYIAGSQEMARHLCLEFCADGFCVNVSECYFAYTGGGESGVKVSLINYARFPRGQSDLTDKAIELAEFLIFKLHQSSASVVSPCGSFFLSRRD